MTVSEVEAAFGISELPRPRMVFPSQPNPWKRNGLVVWLWAINCCAALCIAQMYFVCACEDREVYLGTRQFSRAEVGVEQLLGEFEIKGRPSNVEIWSFSPVRNSWVEVNYEFEREDGSESAWASQAIEYYFGVTGGESWREGSTRASSVLGSLGPGNYKIFATVNADSFARDMVSSVATRIRVDVPIWSNLFLALFTLLAYPCALLVLATLFERRRWQDSDYSPYSHG